MLSGPQMHKTSVHFFFLDPISPMYRTTLLSYATCSSLSTECPLKALCYRFSIQLLGGLEPLGGGAQWEEGRSLQVTGSMPLERYWNLSLSSVLPTSMNRATFVPPELHVPMMLCLVIGPKAAGQSTKGCNF